MADIRTATWRALVHAFVLLAGLASVSVHAEQIVVSNYGVSPNGMPFAVALEKGFFKDAGVNVDGILTSDGGGSTIRNLFSCPADTHPICR